MRLHIDLILPKDPACQAPAQDPARTGRDLTQERRSPGGCPGGLGDPFLTALWPFIDIPGDP